MNSFLRFLNLIVPFVFLFSISSCNGDGHNQTDDEISTDMDQGFIKETESQTYYLIPSPEGLFSFIKEGNLKYSKDILNSTGNIDQYIDTRSKELNFGVYSADLAYVASFNKYQESVDYLNTVRTLSDEIGISAVFDENLIGRIDNIIDDQDSLLKITSDSYFSIVRYLESSNRKKSLALIVTGGWVESIFVVSNMIDNYEQDPAVIQLLADQKLVIDNLMSYLDQNKYDDNIQRTINDLKPLSTIYESLETIAVENLNKKEDSDKIIVGGSSKIIMTKEQFISLKQEIKNIRNKITKN
ncbi:MAG: hypothetical protein JXR51_14835 [Bacteroidales bacterium]|nr:hypothetical protein [Bacteroidales bacterium]MBN2758446.1 hypothetical protein [Bacteroidales bacterium]